MSTEAKKSIKPVLLVATSNGVRGKAGTPTGFWLSELTHAMAKIDDARIPFELASIQGGKPPIDPASLDTKEPTNARYWDAPAFQEALSHTKRLGDVDPSRYSGIFFAGGHGTMWDFPESEAVRRVTREIWEAGGVVSAVCHGPSALVNVRLSDGRYLVAGKRVAAFTNDEETEVKATDIVPFLLESTLVERGAQHQHAPNWRANVVVDGRLVTGQNPSSASGVGAAVRDLLLGTANGNA